MLQITIRTATHHDLIQVAELFNEYRVFYQKESNIALAREFLNARFNANESIIIVAEIADHKLVGFTQLYPTFSSVSAKNAMILNDLFVRPEFRRQGIAEKLISSAIKISKDKNCAWVSLQTAVDNIHAQSLYKRIGFVEEPFLLMEYACE